MFLDGKIVNNKYVYLHISAVTGFVFYVGKGSGYRCNNKERSEEWKKVAELGYTVEVVERNLTNTRAIELELELYLKYKTTIVNKQTPFNFTTLDFKLLTSLFEYNTESPSKLIWKINAPLLNKGIRRLVGKPAGSVRGGYWVVSVLGKRLKVHRIIMCLLSGHDLETHDLIVDHIDGDSENNSADNLRLTTYAENARNKLNGNPRLDGTVGITGVTRVKLQEYTYFMAQYRTIDCNNRSKSFNIKTHGEAEAFRLACEWRKEQIRLLNLQGAGYTDRHGT